MIYDHRTYACRPGTIKKHLALYAKHSYELCSAAAYSGHACDVCAD